MYVFGHVYIVHTEVRGREVPLYSHQTDIKHCTGHSLVTSTAIGICMLDIKVVAAPTMAVGERLLT